MLIPDGEQRLREFAATAYPRQITPVTDTIWHVLGVGHSNATFIEADHSVILIDTLDTLERGRELRRIIAERTANPVATIIYTHGHPDHRGGAGAFADLSPEIIAFTPKTPLLGRTNELDELRSIRQFGYRSLNDGEALSQGIGPREGLVRGEQRAFVPPPRSTPKTGCSG